MFRSYYSDFFTLFNMRLPEFLENLRNSCILFKFIDLYTIFRRDEAFYNKNTNKVKKK